VCSGCCRALDRMEYAAVGGAVAVAAIGVIKYINRCVWKIKHQDLTGHVCIVTGANTGIGKETVRELARMNAEVILCCRDLDKGNAAAQDIIQDTGNKEIAVWKLDLASFKSVREFANRFLETNKPLHLLINNAGIGLFPNFVKTEDGNETPFSSESFGTLSSHESSS